MMSILTDVSKLATLTSLTLMFHTGLEAFPIFHFALKFSTEFSCGSVGIDRISPLVPPKNQSNYYIYPQFVHAH
jgi:hypothetical protein